MDVLGDAIARNRRSDAPALVVPGRDRAYDYRRFCTVAWKVGHVLRHHGVHRGARVAVADEPAPEPVLALYGAAALGAVVRFGPPTDPVEGVAALVVPTADLGTCDVAPGTARIAYGDRPADPSVVHLERSAWSENPTAPPDGVDPDAPLLAVGETTRSHAAVLAAAEAVVDDHQLDAGSLVSVHGALTHPGTVTAGLVAPIVAGGTTAIGPATGADLVVGPDGDVNPDGVLQ